MSNDNNEPPSASPVPSIMSGFGDRSIRGSERSLRFGDRSARGSERSLRERTSQLGMGRQGGRFGGQGRMPQDYTQVNSAISGTAGPNNNMYNMNQGGGGLNFHTDQQSNVGTVPSQMVDDGNHVNNAFFSALREQYRKFVLEFTLTGETSPGDAATSVTNVPYYKDQLDKMIKRYESADDDDDEDIEKDISIILPIDCTHLSRFNERLYIYLRDNPSDCLTVLDMETYYIVVSMLPENLQKYTIPVKVKPYNLPSRDCRKMRDLNSCDIENLITMQGIVIRCSDLIPDMNTAQFKCTAPNCNEEQTVRLVKNRVNDPQLCPECGGKNTFELRHNFCSFGNKQYVKLQESPESIPAGECPQTVNLYCFDELVDVMRPGDRVEITGVLRAQAHRTHRNARQQRCVYYTYVDTLCVRKEFTGNSKLATHKVVSKPSFVPLSNEDDIDERIVGEDAAKLNKKIRDLGKDNDIRKKLINSLAPSIHENEHVKTGLLCQLFQGTCKVAEEQRSLADTTKQKGRMREQIHILLCGDPSTAKSQLMTAVNKLAPRGVITSGKGTTVTGLTAYITKDQETGDIMMESGALVLSDQGVCGIDEFDKMDDGTRAVLHEAMEQQTVSIAKSGIVCNLNAKVSILATANPIMSKYDPSRTLMENINLPPTLSSRFDLLYLMLDKHDPVTDQQLARHIVGMFAQNGRMATDHAPIDRMLLRAYIEFARSRCRPVLSTAAQTELKSTYLDLRNSADGGACASPRTLESLIRISESFAKMELREDVTAKDVKDAYSLLSAATFKSAIDPVTGKIDMEALRTGISRRDRQLIEIIKPKILEKLTENSLTFDETYQQCNEHLQNRGLLQGQSTLKMQLFRQAISELVHENKIDNRDNVLTIR